MRLRVSRIFVPGTIAGLMAWALERDGMRRSLWNTRGEQRRANPPEPPQNGFGAIGSAIPQP